MLEGLAKEAGFRIARGDFGETDIMAWVDHVAVDSIRWHHGDAGDGLFRDLLRTRRRLASQRALHSGKIADSS